MAYLTNRILTPELMDRDDVPTEQLRRSLAFIRKVNRWLGGSRAVVGHLARWSRDWPTGPGAAPIRILDIATGGGDIPLAIVDWARRHGRRVHVTAMDRHEKTLALAAEHVGDEPAIQLLRADALHLPFATNSFDYAVTSMFLHHLSDIEVMTVLREMDLVARRGMIWNDLLRHRRAYWWCRLLTLGSHPIVQHDAAVSVLAGFRKAEVLDLCNRLDLRHLSYHRHFGHRFTLAGQR